MKQKFAIIFFLVLSLSMISSQTAPPIGADIVANMKSRIKDAWGKGQFLASRDKNTRLHAGLDVVATPGETVYAPFEGTIVREAFPYKDDKTYRGVVLRGTGEWKGYEMKIFYVEGNFSGAVSKGAPLGKAQNLTAKYKDITNHIHVEVRVATVLIDPFEVWQMSF